MHTEPGSRPQEAADEQESATRGGRHHAKEGADRHPLIDLDRDPTPGVPDHAKPESPED